MTALLDHLDAARAAGRKLLIPYVMAGIPAPESFPAALAATSEGADAVEVGLPYSDPLMDGPVIAAAAERALRGGVGPVDALDLVSGLESAVPRVAMTYYNPIHRVGEAEFCRRAAKAGVSGLIVPDLPIEEADGLRACAAEEGLAWVPLVAPTSAPARVEAIVATATGFVYAVSTLGVTGTREELSERAAAVVSACRQFTGLPVVVGIGISNPEQAAAVAAFADGVVVGSAVVRRLVEDGVDAARSFLREMRAALGR